MIEERWKNSNSCTLCDKLPPPNYFWSEEHCSIGISGFTFVFCDSCSKNKRKECDKMMTDCMSNWRKQCEEHWAKKSIIL